MVWELSCCQTNNVNQSQTNTAENNTTRATLYAVGGWLKASPNTYPPIRAHTLSPALFYTARVKKSTLKFSGIFPQMVGNYLSKFYVPVIRSYLRSTTIFCSINCKFDDVMPYIKFDHPACVSADGGHFEHLPA